MEDKIFFSNTTTIEELLAFLNGIVQCEVDPINLSRAQFNKLRDFYQENERVDCGHGGLFFKGKHIHIL